MSVNNCAECDEKNTCELVLQILKQRKGREFLLDVIMEVNKKLKNSKPLSQIFFIIWCSYKNRKVCIDTKEERSLRELLKDLKEIWENPVDREKNFTEWLTANGKKYTVIDDKASNFGECYERYLELLQKNRKDEMER